MHTDDKNDVINAFCEKDLEALEGHAKIAAAAAFTKLMMSMSISQQKLTVSDKSIIVSYVVAVKFLGKLQQSASKLGVGAIIYKEFLTAQQREL